jgi:hypothetical protein
MMNSEIKFEHVKMSHIQRYVRICMLRRGDGEIEPRTLRIYFQVTFRLPWLQLLLITQTLRVRNLLIYL